MVPAELEPLPYFDQRRDAGRPAVHANIGQVHYSHILRANPQH